MKERQTKRMGVRFTPAEARMVKELAEARGLSMADIIRQAIRRKHAEHIKARGKLGA